MDSAIKLIEALAVSAWPAIVFYVIFSYRSQIANLLESAKNREFTIEVGGQKLSMKEANQQQQKFIEDLQKQLNELRKKIDGFELSSERKLNRTLDNIMIGEISGTNKLSTSYSNAVLWADDNPKNNSYFIDLLKNRGYRVDLALSTSDALSNLSKSTYRLVLSDMGRIEKGSYVKNAGVILLEEIRKQNVTVPYVVYCSSQNANEFQEQVKKLDGYTITSSATALRAILDELAPNNIS